MRVVSDLKRMKYQAGLLPNCHPRFSALGQANDRQKPASSLDNKTIVNFHPKRNDVFAL